MQITCNNTWLAVRDEPRDALCHGKRVVNKGRSVRLTCDSQTKLTTLATAGVPRQKSRKTGQVWSLAKGSREKYLHCWRYTNSITKQSRYSKGSSDNQLDPFRHFGTTLACERLTLYYSIYCTMLMHCIYTVWQKLNSYQHSMCLLGVAVSKQAKCCYCKYTGCSIKKQPPKKNSISRKPCNLNS